MAIRIEQHFDGYPLDRSKGETRKKHPLLVQGDAICEIKTVHAPLTATQDILFPPGDLEKITWTIFEIDLYAGRKGRHVIDLAANPRVAEDLKRWVRGRHGYEIERQLRKLYRDTVYRSRIEPVSSKK